MKRSHMLEVLEVGILDAKGQLNAAQLAEKLLTRIEQLGMKPPPYRTGERIGYTWGWEDEEVCEWEKE